MACAKFSPRLFSAGSSHHGAGVGISTSILWDSFSTQISTVLTPRGQVEVVLWGKLDMIKSVGFSKVIQMTEGIKRDSSSQSIGQWQRRAGCCRGYFVTVGSRRLLSIQLPIAYLNGISQNPRWLLIFTARKTQGKRISKGTKKKKNNKWRPKAKILSPVHLKACLSNQKNFLLQEQRLSLYYSLWLITAHRSSFPFENLIELLEKQPLYPKQRTRGRGRLGHTVPRSSLSAPGFLGHIPAPSPTSPAQPELGTSSSWRAGITLL